jgi:uncharacterized membrane protein
MSIVLSSNGTQTLHPDKHDSNESSKKYGNPPTTRITRINKIPGSVRYPVQVWALEAYQAFNDGTIAAKGMKMRSLLTYINQGEGRALKPLDRLMLQKLVNQAGRDDVRHTGRTWVAITYAGIDFLSQELNVSPATVKRSLKRLEQAGLITRKRTMGTNSLTIVEWHDAPRKPAPKRDPRESANCTQEEIKVIPPSDQNDPAHVYQSLKSVTLKSVTTTSNVENRTPAPTTTAATNGPAPEDACLLAANDSHHLPEAERRYAERSQALEDVGIIGQALKDLASRPVLTPSLIHQTHGDWKLVGTKKEVTTGLLVSMLQQIATIEEKQAKRYEQAEQERLQEEREAVIEFLYTNERECINACTVWTKSGRRIEEASVENPDFVEWARNALDANGKLRQVVTIHQAEKARNGKYTF